MFETASNLLGDHAWSPQLPVTHTNVADTRGTMEKNNSDQFWTPVMPTPCFFDCPRALWGRTPCFLDLHSRFYVDLSIYARIYAKLKPF